MNELNFNNLNFDISSTLNSARVVSEQFERNQRIVDNISRINAKRDATMMAAAEASVALLHPHLIVQMPLEGCESFVGGDQLASGTTGILVQVNRPAHGSTVFAETIVFDEVGLVL